VRAWKEGRVRHACVLLARQVLWSRAFRVRRCCRFSKRNALAKARYPNSMIGLAELASAPLASDADGSFLLEMPLIAYE